MFSRNRRWLAAAGLMAALLLAVPAPTLAAGLWPPATDMPGLVVLAWSWLESRVAFRWAPRPTTVVWEKEGVMIDPDGATTTSTAPVPSTAASDSRPAGVADGH